jgi:hypothetical protein
VSVTHTAVPTLQMSALDVARTASFVAALPLAHHTSIAVKLLACFVVRMVVVASRAPSVMAMEIALTHRLRCNAILEFVHFSSE